MDHRIVGMQILAVVIQDINPPTFARGSGKFRRAGKEKERMCMNGTNNTKKGLFLLAGGFRDTQLLDVFRLAYSTLKDLNQRSLPFTSECK